MKLTIGDYEVEIKAKWRGAERMSKENTMYFLNMIASEMYAASRQRESEGYMALAEESTKMANEIHNLLDSKGFYDNIKKNA